MFLYRNFMKQESSGDPLITDIMRNLQWIFDTKRGCGYFIPEFGLTQGGFRTKADIIEAYTDEIKEIIDLFEPRLKFLELGDDYDPETGRIKLEIECKFADSGEPFTIRLDPQTNQLNIVKLSTLEGE